MSTRPSPLSRQVGGVHYQAHAIQPIAIAMGNRLSPALALALKHVTRPTKGQLREDIEKALHYLEFDAEQWPTIGPNEFIDGLSAEVPSRLREAAWHIVMAANPMATPAEQRGHARSQLQAALKELGERAQ